MIKKLVVLGLLLVVGSGCSSEEGATQESKSPQKIQQTVKEKREIEKKREVLEAKAENGEVFRYTLPKGWQKGDTERSDLYVNSQREGLDFLTATKEDFVDFPSYQNAITKSIEDSGDKIVEQGTSAEINGMPGVELVVESSRDGEKFKALVYLLESERNYLQIHTSTHLSRFDANREKLKEAASSLERAEG